MRQWRNMFQPKEHSKIPEELSEVKIGNLPKREFRVFCVFLIWSKNSGEEWREKLEVFYEELENIKNNQTDEEYNNWSEKYTRRSQ